MSALQSRSGNLILFGGIQVDISQLNFNDHSSNVAAIKISCIVFIALIIPVVTLRIYSRLKCGYRISADDGVFVTIFQCTPVRGAWDFTIQGRRCVNYVTYLYASSAVNVATDIVLCLLPLPHLWRLQLPLRERVVLCVLLAGGASACVVGSVRIAFLGRLRVLDTTPFQDS
ncbi:hypothetical protein CFE70_000673 [Pyrenophora teres f. teres 0-1]